ncbi:hypothetical protein LMG33818_000662 [Halomonadaceae bacterium LMG 33818]|uniref:YqcC family protein n=1 Tax=Cernens ardua TaxID=3402176 RepID=UPI003EDC50F1
MSQQTELSDALSRLEAAMRAAGIWSLPRPDDKAFESLEPFALDSMNMAEWLRYIFVPQLRTLLGENRPLPSNCSVTPAAQVYLPDMSEGAKLPVLMVLQEIDELLSTEGGQQQDPKALH